MIVRVNNGQTVQVAGVSGPATFVRSPKLPTLVFLSSQRRSEFQIGIEIQINGEAWKVSSVDSGENSTLVAGLEPVEGN